MAQGAIILTSALTTFFSFRQFIKSRKDTRKLPVSNNNRVEHPTSVIVGTGIIGLTSAYYLAKSGHKVICIEKREDVALETSYKNGSLICPSLLTPWANTDVPKKFIKSFLHSSSDVTSTKIWPSTFLSIEFYRWIYEYLKNCTHRAQLKNAAHLLALSMYSRRCLDEIIDETSISFSRCSTGSLQLAVNEEIFQQLIEESEHIPQVQLLSNADQVIGLEPILTTVKDRLYAAVFSSLDTNGNIHEFCCEMKKILKEKYQVQFIFNQELKDFLVTKKSDNHLDDRRHRIAGIITHDNHIIQDVDNIIVTNGNYVLPLMKKLNLYIPIYPVKGYVVEIKTPPNVPLPKANLVDDVNKLYISTLKPTEKRGLVRVSGLAEFAGWKDIGVLSEPDRAQYLYEQTIHWLPHLAPYEKDFHSCSRPVSPDDVPLIGRCQDFDNLYVNCGHGSKGWTLAFGSAALLTHVINQTKDVEQKDGINPDSYTPNRFM